MPNSGKWAAGAMLASIYLSSTVWGQSCAGPGDCFDGDLCTLDRCIETVCQNPPHIYGDIDENGTVNLLDLFCVLAGIVDEFTSCTFEQVDLEPCGGNGTINLLDLFAVLNAFSAIDPCCGTSIGACCTGGGCVDVITESDCNAAPGTFLGAGTDCTTDGDSDGIVDAFETDDCLLSLPCATGTDPTNPDTDGDGLLDGEEVFGTAGGVDLPAMGADPCRKDIFVETDWTDDSFDIGSHSHRPTTSVVNAIVGAFANSPVPNPDGSIGINLHVDYGQGGAFTGGNFISGSPAFIVFGSEFNSLKAIHFDPDRKGYFHYSIFTHRYNSSTNNSSGVAEINADDFMVTLPFSPTSTSAVSKTMMHELGHNLNLRHGGFENRNYKPNYNSVMNYRFQFPGIDGGDCNSIGNGIIDYSIGTRIVLNENNLDESAGVCGATPIDWNGGGIQSGVIRNINCSAGTTTACGESNGNCDDSSCNQLQDFNDWANIVYDNLGVGDFAARETVTCQDDPGLP